MTVVGDKKFSLPLSVFHSWLFLKLWISLVSMTPWPSFCLVIPCILPSISFYSSFLLLTPYILVFSRFTSLSLLPSLFTCSPHGFISCLYFQVFQSFIYSCWTYIVGSLTGTQSSASPKPLNLLFHLYSWSQLMAPLSSQPPKPEVEK